MGFNKPENYNDLVFQFRPIQEKNCFKIFENIAKTPFWVVFYYIFGVFLKSNIIPKNLALTLFNLYVHLTYFKVHGKSNERFLR